MRCSTGQSAPESSSDDCRSDELFRQFDKRIREGGVNKRISFRATLVGHFFAGDRIQRAGVERWEGYGHLGCCSLLVIQQVLAVRDVPGLNDERRIRSAG